MRKIALGCLQGFLFLIIIEGSFRLRTYLMPGPTVAAVKSGERHILVIGDSISLNWPARLQDLLSRNYPTQRWRVINTSYPAARTSEVMQELPRQLEKWQPDVIVTMIGKSDYSFGDEPSWIMSKFRLSRLFFLFGGSVRNGWNSARLDVVYLYKWLSFHGEALPTHFALGTKFEAAGDIGPALEHFRKVIRIWESSSHPRQYAADAAQAYAAVARIDQFGPEAKESLQKGAALLSQTIYPKSKASVADGKLGLAYARAGDPKSAEKWLRASLDLDKDNFLSVGELAWVYYTLKDWPDAEIMFERLVDKYPDYSRAIGALTESYRHTGHLRKGIHLFQGLLEKVSKKDVIAEQISSLEFLNGQVNNAAENFQNLPTLFQTGAQFRNFLGYLRVAGQKAELDKTYAETEIEDAPSDFSVKCYRGLIKIAAEAQIPVIALQYPVNSGKSLSRILAGKEDSAIALDTKASLVKAMRETGRPVTDFLREDFEHLTPAGSEIVAGMVMETIEKNLTALAR